MAIYCCIYVYIVSMYVDIIMFFRLNPCHHHSSIGTLRSMVYDKRTVMPPCVVFWARSVALPFRRLIVVTRSVALTLHRRNDDVGRKFSPERLLSRPAVF